MYKLIKMTADYADEFDCKAFALMSDEAWEKLEDRARSFDDDQEVYFGTNEYIEISSFRDWAARLNIADIADEEAITLERLFGDPSTTTMHDKLSGKITLAYGVGVNVITQYGAEY